MLVVGVSCPLAPIWKIRINVKVAVVRGILIIVLATADSIMETAAGLTEDKVVSAVVWYALADNVSPTQYKPPVCAGGVLLLFLRQLF